jgi:hypothetical protein
VSSGTAPVDWNNDGDTADTALSLNVNGIPRLGCKDASMTALPGFDDWANLVYDFQNTADFADGAHTSTGDVDEVTFSELAAVAPDTDGDGVSNLDDNCLTVANAGQADADADGAGDACDSATAPGPTPDPGPGPVPAPGPGPGTPCRDTVAPTVAFGRLKLTRKAAKLSGSARDDDCGGVTRVEVALALKTGTRCRFAGARGRLGKKRACSAPVWLKAEGSAAWTLKRSFKPRLPRGTYSIRARARDAATNSGKPATRTRKLR